MLGAPKKMRNPSKSQNSPISDGVSVTADLRKHLIYFSGLCRCFVAFFMSQSIEQLIPPIRHSAFSWLSILAFGAIISGCAVDSPNATEDLTSGAEDSLTRNKSFQEGELAPLMATFAAIRLLVEPLAGERHVDVLLDPGVSPHAYSPKPSDVRNVRRSLLLVYAHQDVDGWTSSLTDGNRFALFSPSDSEMETQGRNTDHSHGDDPHFWTDPVAATLAVRALSDQLCSLDPDRCAATRRQATAFSARIDSTQKAIESRFSASNLECVITAEPFLDRFLDRFGISHIGPVSRSPELEPSPAGLASLLREAKRRNCSLLVVPSFQENRFTQRLARDNEWEIIEVDALATRASSYEDYLDLLATAILASTND